MDPSLGISEADEAAIVRDVSVIFHSAATINFEEVTYKTITSMPLSNILTFTYFTYLIYFNKLTKCTVWNQKASFQGSQFLLSEGFQIFSMLP